MGWNALPGDVPLEVDEVKLLTARVDSDDPNLSI